MLHLNFSKGVRETVVLDIEFVDRGLNGQDIPHSLINVTAIVVLWLSLVRRNKELRNVAIVLIVIGAGKVFLMDMVSLKGMPLMISVFTFGLVAAFASFVIGCWNKAGEAIAKG